MAAEAEEVVVSLVARNQQFDAAVKSSADKFTTATAQIGKSASSTEAVFDKLVTTTGRSRMGMQQLSFQVADVSQQMALSVPFSRIFIQQSAQVIQAIQIMGGEGNAFLRFLGGPWGIALATASVAITPLIGKLFESKNAVGDLIEQMKKQAQASRDSAEADAIWANSLDGLIERQKKLNDELGKRLQTQSAVNRQGLSDAEADRDRLKSELQSAQRQVANAKKALEDAKAAQRRAIDPSEAQGAAAAVSQAQDRLTAAQKKVTDVTNALSEAQSRVTRSITIIGEAQSDLAGKASDFGQQMKNNVAALIDSNPALASFAKSLYGASNALGKSMSDAAGANVGFDAVAHKVDDLYKRLSLGKITVQTYTSELRKMAKALEDSAKAAKQTTTQIGELSKFSLPVQGRVTGNFGESRPGHTHAGVDIAVPVGTPVHAPAGGTVIEAGTLPGYGNVVFIDHGGGTITRLAHLSQISVQRGQQVGAGAVVGLSGGAKGAPGSGDSTGPHVHYEVRVNGKAVNPLTGQFTTDQAGALAKAQDAAQQIAEKQVQSNLDFAKKSADLDAKILDARDDQVKDELARADISEQRIRAEQAALDAQIDSDATAKKNAGLDAATVDAQAAILHQKNAQLTAEKIATVELLKETEIAKRAHEAADQRYGFAIDDLKASEQLATSNEERRKIELELLDLKYQQKLEDLEYLKQQAIRNGKLADANMIQGQIDHLPYEKGAEAVGIELNTMGPWQSFLKEIPADAKAANEALQSIAVDGVHSLVDGLGQAGAAWIKMGGIAGQIIKTLVSKLITLILYQQIAHLFGSGITNPFRGQAAFVPMMGENINLTPTLPPITVPDLPAFAGGGMGIIGGMGGTDNNLLSLNGQGVAWVSRGEGLAVIPSNGFASTGSRNLPGNLTINVDARDAVLTSAVRSWVAQGVSAAIDAGSQGGAALARDNLGRKTLHQLER